MDTRIRYVFVIAALINLAGPQRFAFAQEVAVEVRILKVSESVMERLDPNRGTRAQRSACEACPASQKCESPTPCTAAAVPGGPIFLTEAQVKQFIETTQADATTNVMQAPKMTVDSGQTAALNIKDKRFFVTDLAAVQAGAGTVYVPKNELVTTGLQMSVQPIVSADRRFVELSFHAKLSELDPIVPLLPVTTIITPAPEGGAVGKPIPFTQYLEQPHVSRICLDSNVTVADGCSVFLAGGRKRESENVIVLVTPRILVHPEEEMHVASAVVQTGASIMPAPVLSSGSGGTGVPPVRTGETPIPPAPVPAYVAIGAPEKEKVTACQGEGNSSCQVSRLMNLYCRACSDGRLADASLLAIQALAIDPACFSKCAKTCGTAR